VLLAVSAAVAALSPTVAVVSWASNCVEEKVARTIATTLSQ
jgi:hypothetical protein